MKKLLLVCLMLITVVIIFASCEKPTEGLYYRISDDGTYAEVFDYKGTDKDVVIADKYEGLPVKAIADSAFQGCHQITSVKLPESIKSISDNAFKGCINLENINLPNSVTKIGEEAFFRCENLISINIPLKTEIIGAGAFENCKRLKEVVIGGNDMIIGERAFVGCGNLAKVEFVGSVQSIGDCAFETSEHINVTTIKEVHINDIEAWFNISFEGRRSNPLNCPTYGKENRHSVDLYIQGELVTDFVVPDGITSIDEGMFGGCASLTSIVIPDSVISIDYYAFFGCTNLRRITIPDSVTSIVYRAFYDCTSIKTVNYTGTKEQWAAISIDSSNNYLTRATINYNYKPE